jgi:alpha-N-arabinofuranosidase
VIFRSRSPWGPFEPFAGNPILTQRGLDEGRANPITNAGHADLVEAPDGSWWAVFLASRSYSKVHYNTGRETFLLPVTWKDGWPMILDKGKVIPYVAAGPKFMKRATQAPLTGNFTWRDEFDAATLRPEWLQARVPKQQWFDLRAQAGALSIKALPVRLQDQSNPAYLGRRQQHTSFDASTQLTVPETGVAAGLVAFQNEKYWFFLGIRRTNAGTELFLEQNAGKEPQVLATQTTTASAQVKLRISGDAGDYGFFFDVDGKGWRPLREHQDGSILSTDVAGGFIGATMGPYVRSER